MYVTCKFTAGAFTERPAPVQYVTLSRIPLDVQILPKNIMSNFAQSSTDAKIFIIKHLSSEKNPELQERRFFYAPDFAVSDYAASQNVC